jgi:hypothetical protein
MLLDDREKYSIGGAAKSLTKLVTKLNKKHSKRMTKQIDAVDNTQYFDFDDAIKMLDEGDITIAQANQMLKQAGYSEKDVQEFTRAYSGLIFDKKPTKTKKEDPRLKELTPPTADEIDKMLDEAVARGDFAEGGIIMDDRQKLFFGGILKKLFKKVKKSAPLNLVGETEEEAEEKEYNTNAGGISGLFFRQEKKKGGLLDDDRVMYQDGGPGIEALRKEAPEVVERMGYEDGGMLNDNAMENNYTRFIMDEALTEKEEDMLMSKLEQDEELAMIFDKVIDVAQEFAGSGPVEGPGSGVSDSIPARLSDGEFVFTAKAVEEIGADELMRMMKDAEMKADERQGLAEGGMSQEEKPQSLLSSGVMQEDEIAEDELKKRMVQGSSDYVRS